MDGPLAGSESTWRAPGIQSKHGAGDSQSYWGNTTVCPVELLAASRPSSSVEKGVIRTAGRRRRAHRSAHIRCFHPVADRGCWLNVTMQSEAGILDLPVEEPPVMRS